MSICVRQIVDTEDGWGVAPSGREAGGDCAPPPSAALAWDSDRNVLWVGGLDGLYAFQYERLQPDAFWGEPTYPLLAMRARFGFTFADFKGVSKTKLDALAAADAGVNSYPSQVKDLFFAKGGKALIVIDSLTAHRFDLAKLTFQPCNGNITASARACREAHPADFHLWKGDPYEP